jgi:enolase 1/2/3
MTLAITSIRARQVLDSRGRPTVEVDVALGDGSLGRASVPSGASTGAAEAHELRDRDPRAWRGMGVRRAVDHVNGEIARALAGADPRDQRGLDRRLTELDGTANQARLGANAVLGVSLAACRAAAAALGRPLYRHIAELAGVAEPTMPLPMVNLLSGGLHAGRGMDIQDFLVVPAQAASIEQAIAIVGDLRSAATDVLARRGLPTLLADEGGLSPGCESSRDALHLMIEIIEAAGLAPGRDVVIAIDVAATSLYDRALGAYRLAREGRTASGAGMAELAAGWVRDFPVASIEDPLDEEDWPGWASLTARLGDRVQLVGDDLFTTDPQRLARGVREHCANGVLVKPNQNGTLSGTLDVIAAACRAGYAAIVSARSGETEDSFIADLAVGAGAGQIKIGSLRCSDRLAKYNQLLRIEEQSGARFTGIAAIHGGPARR